MKAIIILLLIALVVQAEGKFFRASNRGASEKISIRTSNSIIYQRTNSLCLTFTNLTTGRDNLKLTVSTEPAEILTPVITQLSPLTTTSCYDITFVRSESKPTLAEFNLNVTVTLANGQVYNNSKILIVHPVDRNPKPIRPIRPIKPIRGNLKKNWEQKLTNSNSNDTNGTVEFFNPLASLFNLPIFDSLRLGMKQNLRKENSENITNLIDRLVVNGPLIIPRIPKGEKKLELFSPEDNIPLVGPGSVLDYIGKLIKGETIVPGDYPRFSPKSTAKKISPVWSFSLEKSKTEKENSFFGKNILNPFNLIVGEPAIKNVSTVATPNGIPFVSDTKKEDKKQITQKAKPVVANNKKEDKKPIPPRAKPVIIKNKPITPKANGSFVLNTTKPVVPDVVLPKPAPITTLSPAVTIQTTDAPVINVTITTVPTPIQPSKVIINESITTTIATPIEPTKIVDKEAISTTIVSPVGQVQVTTPINNNSTSTD